MQATDTDTTGRVSMCVTRPNQPMIRQIFLIGLIASFVFSAQHARAADELVPPFGFRWNDSMARVEAVLHGAKAKLVSREKKENREVWTVEGLIHPGLKRTVFTFKERALVAVELQYEYRRRSKYNQRMGEIRKYFDEKPTGPSNVTTSGWEKFGNTSTKSTAPENWCHVLATTTPR